jgi:hypothetical protein
MIGQGRPSSSAFACARYMGRKLRRACLGRASIWAIALAIGSATSLPGIAQDRPEAQPIRLRITWGGGEARRWFGRFGLERGSMSDLVLLGHNADEAGSVWLDEGKVQVASLGQRIQDIIEVTAASGSDATLLFELSHDAMLPRSEIPVALSEVLKEPFEQRLDDRGNSLRVEVVPAQALQVETERDQFIFAPGEQFTLDVTAMIPDAAPGTTLDFRTTLSPARGEGVLWKSDQRLAVPVESPPRLRLSVPLPNEEGAYSVRLAAMRPAGFRDRFFGTPTPLAERKLDLVVLSEQRPAPGHAAQWETVLEIDPTAPRWWERLPNWTQLRRIPGLNRGPLGSLRASYVETPLGHFIELPPTAPDADPHWQAYSLPLEAAGAPHVLEIEYPAEQEQHLGISIVEPNASGVIEGIGRDGGVYVEGFGRTAEKATHRIVFWPRTQAPLLLVTNAHPTAAGHFGHIRVRKLKSGPLPDAANDRSSERLVAAYVARPLLAETFGASKARDPRREPAQGSGDDWQTIYESATRLAEYVRYGGYNSAVVSSIADGSASYPTSLLMPTPRNSGGGRSADDDPRDALELMFRVFDREGLALLPAVQFASPLPELESLRRRSDPQLSGLEWIGPDGRTWLDARGTSDGLAPYYNLLDSRVQQAVIRAIGEMVARYGKHTSFSGLAVQLSGRGYTQLPPLDWGLDDATIGRFEGDTGIQLAASGPGRFAARRAQLTGEHMAAWRGWRAARVSEFYQQLARVVCDSESGRRLLVTFEEAFAHPQLAARVRPALIGENQVDAALLDAGIDRHALQQVPGLVLCRAQFVGTTQPLCGAAVDLEINHSMAGWHREPDPAGTPAAVLYHRPQRGRLNSFAAKSPIQVEGELRVVRQSVAHGAIARQPYVTALVDNDARLLLDGGELLPFGSEDALRTVRSIVQRLPAAAAIAEHSAQPVFVRSYAEPQGTTLLVMNACAWPTKAEIALEVPQPTLLEPLVALANGSKVTPQARQLGEGKQSWMLSLEPYAIEAVRIRTPGAKVVAVQAETSDAAKRELSARLADLANRDLTAPHEYRALANPSFESLSGAGPVPGWKTSGDATAELDATTPQDGKTCAYFHGRGELAALESDTFPTPPTGQLALTVFARCQDVDPRTEMRIVFAANHDGQEYRRAFIVGGGQPGSQRLEPQWRPYAILVNDLPLDDHGRMRVRFELTGPGEIWLDNVKLYDLLCSLGYYPKAQAEIKQFLILLHAAERTVESGRLTDSLRLLEGYWPRFIMAYMPVRPPQQPIAAKRNDNEPASPPPTDEDQEPAPSISERIKRFVPFVR